MRPTEDTRSRVLGYSATLALVVSAALNVWLAYQLGSSRAATQLTRSPPSALLGTTLPALAGRDVSLRHSSMAAVVRGGTEEIRFDGNDCNVLYMFSEHCLWCEKNLPKAAAMQRGVHALGARVIAVSFDQDQAQLRQYIQKKMPQFEVFSELTDDARASLRVPGTPWTAAVDSGGNVLAEWPGAYDDETVESIVSLCKEHAAKGLSGQSGEEAL